ncbi:MAG: UDP-N-acetylmuramoyl-L-alanyl-D-glutamate--2,6-diaminopimelate ligase, partial [Bacteroidota bacterium]
IIRARITIPERAIYNSGAWMKKLNEILKGIKVRDSKGNLDIKVANIVFDSRLVKKGSLFVALAGTQTDGHHFIPQAVKSGAVCIVCEKHPDHSDESVTYVIVDSSAFVLGQMASNFYGNPSSSLKLIGVTGTNGKTTIATLLYTMFRKMGYKAGLLSTIENFVDGRQSKATHTTPDPVQINMLMAERVETGCDFCFMEVSSHAVVQDRIAGLSFAGAVFTNITHDHLDYHGDFKDYIAAKKKFFDGLAKDAFALTNRDDRNGDIMVQNTAARVYTYSLKSMSDFKCSLLDSDINGTHIRIEHTDVWLGFLGEFNVYNLLAVYAVCVLLGQNNKEVLEVLSSLKPVAGRFEIIRSGNGITAIVDYAHTPDALENVLKAIQSLNRSGKQVITVVGAGGNRDRTKRPEMARIAVAMSTKVILTSDNPRNENPEDIMRDMKEGIMGTDRSRTLMITDRREAIRAACMMAEAGDIILVAGKGHENYQEINGVRHHFDDREELEKIFNETR